MGHGVAAAIEIAAAAAISAAPPLCLSPPIAALYTCCFVHRILGRICLFLHGVQ